MVMISVTTPGTVPTGTELLGLKLKVGGYCAPLGPEVTAAVSVTSPMKPPVAAMVTVEVFPVVAPAGMVTGVPVILKPIAGEFVTTIMAPPA